MIPAERKAYDTRPLAFVLTNDDFVPTDARPYVLSGATAAVTIVRPDGVVSRRNVACDVDAPYGVVSYWPTRDDFALAGRYQIQWLVTQSGLSSRWPYDESLGVVVVSPTLDDDSNASRSTSDTVALSDGLRAALLTPGLLLDDLSVSDSLTIESSNRVYTISGELITTYDGDPVTL